MLGQHPTSSRRSNRSRLNRVPHAPANQGGGLAHVVKRHDLLADPEHLLKGAAGGSDTVVMSSTKAIGAYREQKPTGGAGLKQTTTKGD